MSSASNKRSTPSNGQVGGTLIHMEVSMRSKRYRRLVLAGSLTSLIWLGDAAMRAQELTAQNRFLIWTHMATKNVAMWIFTDWVDVVNPTNINCPGTSGTCTVRVEVSFVLRDIPGGGHAAYGQVLVDGVPAAPGPEISLAGSLGSTPTPSSTSAQTFTWVTTGVTAGPHSVQVRFKASHSVLTTERSSTIQVYKP